MKREIIYRIFSHLPELETDRLLLRRMRVSDADDMYAYAHRADVACPNGLFEGHLEKL